jgi:aspartate ammonia-lyase
MIAGALISEGAFLEAHSHSNGAFTRHGATIWQISTEKIAEFRTSKPALFHRIVTRIAVSIYRRLRELSNRLYERKDSIQEVGGFRTEQDSLGNREVSDHAYYGVQTTRALENFSISGIQLSNFSHLIEGLALVKKAAALANSELGVLEEAKMHAITAACDDLLAGNLHEHFVVDMFQGGAGTSTNMNANEVIANRGLELMGREKGDYSTCTQTTTSTVPSRPTMPIPRRSNWRCCWPIAASPTLWRTEDCS